MIRGLFLLVFTIVMMGCQSNRDSFVILSSGKRLELPHNDTLSALINSEPPSLDWIRSSDTDSSWIEDHVMEGLLNLLGADIEKLEAPFIPEGGAYGHGRTHSHSHNHSHHPTTAIYTSDGDPNG